MKSSTFGSVKFVWMNLDRPTRFVRLLQTDSLQRVKIVSGTSIDLHTQRAKLINEKVV